MAALPEAVAHLRAADPVMERLLAEHGPPDGPARRPDPRPTDSYGTLVRAIVGQQLSTKAARTIHGRLLDLYGGRTPTPAELMATDADALRAVGLSRAKAAYLRDLAGRVDSGALDLEHLASLDDDEVSAQLTAVKGIGQWSADMFLIFHLGRPDVLPVGDLGIRRAVQRAYGLDELPSPAELLTMGEPWRPHRSLASLALWRSLDNQPA